MPQFMDWVTDLKNTDLPNLRVKFYCYPSDDPKNGMYKRDLQVDIDGHREISANKFFNLGSDYLKAGLEIELRVFTAADRFGCVLNPLKIRDNLRIIFRRDDRYEDNGRVLIDEIPRENLQKSYRNFLIGRRGFGWLFGRKAYYDALENAVGPLDEDPTSSTLIGSGQPIDEQTLLPQVAIQVASSTTMVSGRLSNEETPQPEIAEWRRPITYLKTKSFLFKARNHGSATAPAV